MRVRMYWINEDSYVKENCPYFYSFQYVFVFKLQIMNNSTANQLQSMKAELQMYVHVTTHFHNFMKLTRKIDRYLLILLINRIKRYKFTKSVYCKCLKA